MTKRAVLYARVSTEEQAKGDSVSIGQQLADMRAVCGRNGWQVAGEFVDSENYKATQNPNKGRMVNPSGERADRPRFLEMLEVVKTGAVDLVICWRDDRLYRHYRVLVPFEDALDAGDKLRNGKAKIAVHDATGAALDRFTMSIKAAVAREENKRRAERIRMGKVGSLQQGRWPGNYDRFGYISRKESGRRGRIIELGDPAEVQTVKDIYNWFDKGISVVNIRRRLIASGAEQTGRRARKHDWHFTGLYRLLRCEDYTGRLVWRFGDGQELAIDIPAIVSRSQWERVQKRLEKGKDLSPRKARRVYILQGIIFCGECGGAIGAAGITHYYQKRADGRYKKYEAKTPQYQYRCRQAQQHGPFGMEHPPAVYNGRDLEWAVWRYLVDNGIKTPETITEQVMRRQRELIEQGDSVTGDINRARRELAEIDQERAFYQRQAAKGNISELEFEQRMTETKEATDYWQGELDRLHELRDNAAAVQSGINYAVRLLQGFDQRLAEIDMTPEELYKLPEDGQNRILRERRAIVRALCDKITVFSSGRIRIDGLLDGAQGASFDYGDTQSQLHKILYSFDFDLADRFFAGRQVLAIAPAGV